MGSNIQAKINISIKIVDDWVSIEVERIQFLHWLHQNYLPGEWTGMKSMIHLKSANQTKLTPFVESMRLLPRLNRTISVKCSTFSIRRILFRNNESRSSRNKHSRFSMRSMQLNDKSNSRKLIKLSKFSILSTLLHLSDNRRKFVSIHKWSIFKIFKNSKHNSVIVEKSMGTLRHKRMSSRLGPWASRITRFSISLFIMPGAWSLPTTYWHCSLSSSPSLLHWLSSDIFSRSIRVLSVWIDDERNQRWMIIVEYF